MDKITKAIITCGGYATRFLPITKAIPKEMLPIVDKPIIHYIAEELSQAGITDILILIGRGRECLQDYFDKHFELDSVIESKGLGYRLNSFADLNITYRRVPLPRGAADNIWHAKSFAGDRPFIVAYCDDIFFDGNPTIELINDFQKNKRPVISATEVSPGEERKYGIIKPGDDSLSELGLFRAAEDDGMTVEAIIEKPKSDPPSNLAACGRYLLLPEVFSLIEDEMLVKEQSGDQTEVCMTGVLNRVASGGGLRTRKTSGTRFDTGTPRGLFEANRYAFDKLDANGI